MSFAIMRIGKLKSHTKGKAGAHNHRLSAEDQPNIDKSRSHLNQYAAGDMVEKINARLPEKRRKDAVEALEIVMTASPDFFETGKGATELNAWANESLKWARDTFGQENVVDWAIHRDEATPHMHVMVVPRIDERLCAKELCGKQNLVKYQDTYARSMLQFGLDRGVRNDEKKIKHQTIKEYRKELAGLRSDKVPYLPVKEGMLDLGYQDRLRDTAEALRRQVQKLLVEREAYRREQKALELRSSALNERERKLSGEYAAASRLAEKIIEIDKAQIELARTMGVEPEKLQAELHHRALLERQANGEEIRSLRQPDSAHTKAVEALDRMMDESRAARALKQSPERYTDDDEDEYQLPSM